LILAPIALGLLIAVYLLIGNKQNFLKQVKKKLPILTLVFFYLLYVLGMLYSSKYGISYNRIDTQLFLVLVPFIFIALDLNLKQIDSVKRVYVISCVIFCLVALTTLIYNLIINYEHRQDYNFVQTSMYHYHYPYDVLYLNAAYVIILFNRGIKQFNFLATFLIFIFIVLSGVRIGFVIFAIITIVYLTINFKRLISFKSILIMTAFLFIGILLIKNSKYVNDKFFDSLSKIGFKTEKYVSDIGEDYHKISLRIKLWSSAIKALKSNPNVVIGYGPQGSREVLNKIYEEEGYDKIIDMNSHNQYLTTLLNNGIIGLIILFLIFFLGLYFSLKLKSTQNILLIFITMMAFITESMLERQKGVVFFTVFLSIILLEGTLKLKQKN